MLFNSYEFILVFRPICLLVFFLLGNRWLDAGIAREKEARPRRALTTFAPLAHPARRRERLSLASRQCHYPA